MALNAVGWSVVISSALIRQEPSSPTLSNVGIVGLHPTQGMDVCVRLFCVR
jgi:hypothetical protein